MFYYHNFDFVKGACSDPQPHPTFFPSIMEILMPEVESYVGGFMCKVACVKFV